MAAWAQLREQIPAQTLIYQCHRLAKAEFLAVLQSQDRQEAFILGAVSLFASWPLGALAVIPEWAGQARVILADDDANDLVRILPQARQQGGQCWVTTAKGGKIHQAAQVVAADDRRPAVHAVENMIQPPRNQGVSGALGPWSGDNALL